MEAFCFSITSHSWILFSAIMPHLQAVHGVLACYKGLLCPQAS